MNFRLPAVLATLAVLGSGVAACNSSDTSGTSGTSGTSASADVKPLAKIDSLSGRTTAVALDAGFVDALTSLKVAPGVLGNAKLTENGSAVFPITGGNVTYYKPGSVTPFVQGEVNHEGSGLSLTAGDTKVDLEDFVIDPGKSVLTGKVSVNGEVAAESAPLFFLDGRTLKALETNSDGTAVLQGTTVKLKQEAADLLNQTFKIDALEAGLVIGVATITVNTK